MRAKPVMMYMLLLSLWKTIVMVGYVYIVDEILGDGVLDDKIVEVKNTEQNACYLKILRKDISFS